MEQWYLIALVDLALIAVLRLLSRNTHHLHHTPDEGWAIHRLASGVVR